MSRQINLQRAEARLRGEKYYSNSKPCEKCGGRKRYTVNTACVSCAVARGKTRYAGLDTATLAEIKRRDHDRYVKRMAESP